MIYVAYILYKLTVGFCINKSAPLKKSYWDNIAVCFEAILSHRDVILQGNIDTQFHKTK